MIDFTKMSANDLVNLKANINEELARRERVEYDKALKKFSDALYELCSKFPNKECFTDDCETWEELYEDHSWNF